MKRLVSQTRGLVKGTPSAVLFSIAIHVGILLVAGGMVVFTIVKKQEQKFEPPPPVERPKMELKKPKVKVKKRARPKASQRIVSKNLQSMAEIQLPEVSSLGEGLGGGIGGFELIPDVSDMSLFGSESSVAMGNDFEGTFYSLSYDHLGHETGLNRNGLWRVIRQFHENGWNVRTFRPYYKSPRKLYATHFMIPPFPSRIGPTAFGIHNPEFKPVFWVVYYTGHIASRKTGKFRFWGMGDEMLIVRINEKIVFDGTWEDARGKAIPWEPTCDLNWKYYMGHGGAAVGHWFELEAETPVKMEVLLEENGGYGGFLLAIEDESQIYPKNRDGMPILPAFKTAEFSESVKAHIEYGLIPGEIDLDSDVMFNVY